MEAKITLLPGDGIGPEVVAEAEKVMAAIANKFGHTFSTQSALAGGIAIDETGNLILETGAGVETLDVMDIVARTPGVGA